jgi:hypothetical protein
LIRITCAGVDAPHKEVVVVGLESPRAVEGADCCGKLLRERSGDGDAGLSVRGDVVDPPGAFSEEEIGPRRKKLRTEWGFEKSRCHAELIRERKPGERVQQDGGRGEVRLDDVLQIIGLAPEPEPCGPGPEAIALTGSPQIEVRLKQASDGQPVASCYRDGASRVSLCDTALKKTNSEAAAKEEDEASTKKEGTRVHWKESAFLKNLFTQKRTQLSTAQLKESHRIGFEKARYASVMGEGTPEISLLRVWWA